MDSSKRYFPPQIERRKALEFGALSLLTWAMAACRPIQPRAMTDNPTLALQPPSAATPQSLPTAPAQPLPTEPPPVATALTEPEMEPQPAATQPELPPVTVPPVTVEIRLFAFQPAEIEVAAGTTVVWINTDDIDHSVTSGSPDMPDGRFDSGLFPLNGQFSYTFTAPGDHAYYCTRHPHMVGRVVVAPA